MKTVQDLLAAGYKSLGWSNQYDNNPAFWKRYHSLKWDTITTTRTGYTLQACHETKEFIETDSGD